MEEFDTEPKLHLTLKKEGSLVYKQYVLDLEIAGLGLNPAVGVSRDLLIPLFDCLKKYHQYLDLNYDGSYLKSYRGAIGSGKGSDILKIDGSFKLIDQSKKDSSEIIFTHALATEFNRYQDGEIFHLLKWKSLGTSSSLTNKNHIADLLNSVGVYINTFQFSFDEFSKVGFVYRFLNIPNKSASFNLKIDQDFKLNIKYSKSTSNTFVSFVDELFELLIDILDFDSDLANQLQVVSKKVRTWLELN